MKAFPLPADMELTYRHGRCPVFALALHQELGYPMVAYLDEEACDGAGDEIGTALVHAYCKRPDGVLVDVGGPFPSDELDEEFGDVNEPSTVYLADPKELRHLLKYLRLPHIPPTEVVALRAFIREHLDRYQ